ncbi:MAG: hypothetical protein EBY32_10615 [Proteobacteria bacterium]|jgi:hypothetical protein|nr:hypothetical protein [Pseudomonadota bacterium]
MNEILQENKRLRAEVDHLLIENMELTAVIRALRKNAREDAATIETAKRELWLWKNGKYEKSTEGAND